MSEEKENKKEEAVQKAKAPEPAKAKSETAAPKEAKTSGKKGRKVAHMTLAQVEKELKSVQEKMGGFQSAFARHLLARKKELSGL